MNGTLLKGELTGDHIFGIPTVNSNHVPLKTARESIS
jgi:hypothetical protein